MYILYDENSLKFKGASSSVPDSHNFIEISDEEWLNVENILWTHRDGYTIDVENNCLVLDLESANAGILKREQIKEYTKAEEMAVYVLPEVTVQLNYEIEVLKSTIEILKQEIELLKGGV